MYTIRNILAKDRPAILKIIEATKMFSDAEIAVATELIDIVLQRPDQKDYLIYVSVNAEDAVCGYICIGPTPATEGTFDFYWMAIEPRLQGQGLGQALLHHAEQYVRSCHGRLIIIETSSQDKYYLTRKFYLKNNYSVIAQIKDFYRLGDDRLIYVKYLNQ